MLRPDTVGVRGSMAIRLRPCMRSSAYLPSSTPPITALLNSALYRKPKEHLGLGHPQYQHRGAKYLFTLAPINSNQPPSRRPSRNIPRKSVRKGLHPFRTAVPFWAQTTQILSNLSPKRDCGPKKRANPPILVRRYRRRFNGRSRTRKTELFDARDSWAFLITTTSLPYVIYVYVPFILPLYALLSRQQTPRGRSGRKLLRQKIRKSDAFVLIAPFPKTKKKK